MLRYPNPGSTIDNFIAIFNNINKELSGYRFNLDDMVNVTIKANLSSSSGYVGQEAIALSTRKDRSRDPLYNQLKMYGELFRHLGWIKSTPESALEFVISPLGELVANRGRNFNDLLIKCILCFSYPNMSIVTNHHLNIRPFFTILKIP